MVWIIIGIVFVILIVLAILFIVGAASTYGAMDELQRELDDREQEEYIRKWVEKHGSKTNKQKRH